MTITPEQLAQAARRDKLRAKLKERAQEAATRELARKRRAIEKWQEHKELQEELTWL